MRSRIDFGMRQTECRHQSWDALIFNNPHLHVYKWYNRGLLVVTFSLPNRKWHQGLYLQTALNAHSRMPGCDLAEDASAVLHGWFCCTSEASRSGVSCDGPISPAAHILPSLLYLLCLVQSTEFLGTGGVTGPACGGPCSHRVWENMKYINKCALGLGNILAVNHWTGVQIPRTQIWGLLRVS